MVYQNDTNNLPIIQTSGCFFRSMGILAEKITGKSLTSEQLNTVWKDAQKIGYLGNHQPYPCGVKLYEGFNPKCTSDKCASYDQCDFNLLKNPAAVGTLFLHELGDKGKLVEVGVIRNGKENYYSWARDPIYDNKFYVRKCTQNGPQGTHFVAVINGQDVDPHDPAIKLTGEVYTIAYAYLKG